MLGGISAGYDRDLAGLQRGWRRLLLRRPRRRLGPAAAPLGGPTEAEVRDDTDQAATCLLFRECGSERMVARGVGFLTRAGGAMGVCRWAANRVSDPCWRRHHLARPRRRYDRSRGSIRRAHP